MKIHAIRCNKCGDTVYSRARHDFRYCSCGSVFADGGLEYQRYGFGKSYVDELPTFTAVEIDVDVTPKELYDDWNHRHDCYGLIKSS